MGVVLLVRHGQASLGADDYFVKLPAPKLLAEIVARAPATI